MPGRSLTPPDVKRAKRAAMIAQRVRARPRDAAAALALLCREVIRAVQAGDNVTHACNARGFHPGLFWDSLAVDVALVTEYEAALRNRAAIHGEQPVALVDDALLDPVAFYTDKNGVKRIDPGYIQLQKLRINARQWDAERLRPELYAPPSTAADRGPIAVTVHVERYVVGSAERMTQDEGEPIPQQQQRERA